MHSPTVRTSLAVGGLVLLLSFAHPRSAVAQGPVAVRAMSGVAVPGPSFAAGYGLGFTMGLGADVPVARRWSVSAGLSYDVFEGDDDDLIALLDDPEAEVLVAGGGPYQQYVLEASVHYHVMPEASVRPSLLLGLVRQSLRTDERLADGPDERVISRVEDDAAFGVQAGAGVRHTPVAGLRVFAEALYRLNLTSPAVEQRLEVTPGTDRTRLIPSTSADRRMDHFVLRLGAAFAI